MKIRVVDSVTSETAAASVGSAFPVQHAVLCLDCERVYERRGTPACPVCASRSYAPIARWLNRWTPPTSARS